MIGEIPFIEQIMRLARVQDAKVYLVGGAVRDLLLARRRYDLDLAVLGNASALARRFGDQVGGAFYVMDAEHDVARVICEQEGARYVVDFARVRGETIEQDLATRDFTINAMAMDVTRGTAAAELIDPFQGQADVAARRLRAIADPVFQNDAVRLLRAVRFEAQLGFAIDETTGMLIRRDAQRLADAPGERVRDEFYKIMAADDPARSLRRMDALGLLEYVLPEVTALKGVTQSPPHVYDVYDHALATVTALVGNQSAGYQNLAEGAFAEQLRAHFAKTVSAERTREVLLRFAALLHDTGKRTTRTIEPDGRIRFLGHEEVSANLAENYLQRLRFSNQEIALVKTILAHHLRPLLLAAEPRVTDRAVYRYFRDMSDAGVDVAVHARADQQATYADVEHAEVEASLHAVIARVLDRYYHAHEKIVAPPSLLTGHDVMQLLGIPPGRAVGEWLEQLKEAQAVGEVTTRAEALAFLQAHVDEKRAPSQQHSTP